MPENTNTGINIISLSGNPPAGGPAGTAGSPAGTAGAIQAPAQTAGGAATGSFELDSLAKLELKSADPPAPAATASSPAAKPAPTGAPADMQSFFNRQTTVKQAEPKILESLVAQKAAADKTKPILGNAPSLQKALEQEKDFKLKRKLRFAQVILLIVFFAAGGMAFYFYSELSSGFNMFGLGGQNTTDRLFQLNNNLKSKQTELNRDRYLSAQVELNSFSFVADTYLDSTSKMANANLSAEDKQALMLDAESAASQMPGMIERIRNLLSPSLVTPTVRSEAEPEVTDDLANEQKAVEDLRVALTDRKTQLLGDKAAADTNKQEIRLIDNSLKLLGNKVLVNNLKAISTDQLKTDLEAYIADLDPLKRKNIQDMVASVLASTSSDIATISALKSQKVDWLDIISKVEKVTKEVDPSFNPLDPNREATLKTLGGIDYTGFDFSGDTNTVGLTGVYKTFDSSNFKKISDLINSFEDSSYFKNIDMRSFAKSGSPEDGYTANFRFSLTIESNSATDNAKKISLVKKIMAEKASRKRIQQ